MSGRANGQPGIPGALTPADELVARYEDRAARVRASLVPMVEKTSVLSPQVAFDHAEVRDDADDSFSSAVLTELGFTLAPLALVMHLTASSVVRAAR